MEPLSACDSRLREMISPMMGHYNTWQKKISSTLDGNRAADTGMYCDEVDFDFSRVDPGEVRKFEEMRERFAWTEDGPPE
jgi:hypothetical protein